ncbi:MAG: hypothetical protein ABIN96_06490 [Rubrivivax sp.]
MRTTVDIEDDVLQAAREAARMQKRPIGAVISSWARSALLQGVGNGDDGQPHTHRVESPLAKHGIEPLPRRGAIVTNELVNRLRDEEGI